MELYIAIFSIFAVLIIIQEMMFYICVLNTSYPTIKYSEFKAIFNLYPDKWDYCSYDYSFAYDDRQIEPNSYYTFIRARHDINRYNKNEINKISL